MEQKRKKVVTGLRQVVYEEVWDSLLGQWQVGWISVLIILGVYWEIFALWEILGWVLLW